MSKISTIVQRVDNKKVVNIRLYIEQDKPYESASIAFMHDHAPMDIYWSSAGSVRGRKIHISTDSHVDINLEHIHNMESFECLISYLQGEDLLFYETLVIHIDKSPSIDYEQADIAVVSSSKGNFENKLRIFKNQVLRQASPWKIYLSVVNNIIVSVNTHGNKKIFVSFGELNAEVASSDFIFCIEPRKHKTIIPKEVFWSKYDVYAPNARLCICQLVKADFHSVDNMYYKTAISNIVPMSSFSKRKKTDLRNFRSPIGRQLYKYWMIDKNSNLPIFRN